MYSVLLAQTPTSLPCYLRAVSYATPPSCQALVLSVVRRSSSTTPRSYPLPMYINPYLRAALYAAAR